MKSRGLFKVVVGVLIVFVQYSIACKKHDEGNQPSPAADSLGVGWQRIDIDDSLGFTDVFFPTSSIGYICRNRYIGKSIDGGLTWRRLPFSDSVVSAFNIFFTDPDHGWVLGAGLIYITTNGGENWQRFPNTNFIDIQFLNSLEGFGVNFDGLMKTTNGGLSWMPVGPRTQFVGVYFGNSSQGWVTDRFGNIRRTTDGGASFPFTRPVILTASNYIIQFTDELHGWVAGAGSICRSTDAGNSWSVLKIPDAGPSDVSFFGSDSGHLMGAQSIYRTIDGGNTFTRVAHVAGDKLIEIHFTDFAHGWAVGPPGRIYRFVQP